MKILVTGAGKNAFLGKHVKNLLSAEFDANELVFVGSEYDLTESMATLKLFNIVRPTVVVHLAALCGGIGLNKKKPADLTAANLKMSVNIVDACKVFNVDYLVGLGSTCGYPKFASIPFKESDYFGAYPEETNAGYGYSKRMLCLLQNTYREQYGLNSIHLVPSNLYGPYDHFDLENSHVIPALINKFVRAKQLKLDEVYCWGTGKVTREFCYAGDVAEAIFMAILMQEDCPDPVNIGTGSEISISDLAELISKLVGYSGDIVFTGEMSDGQPRRRLDVSKAKEVLSFSASTSLEEGLVETINRYKENYDK